MKRQLEMTLPQMLADLPKACNIGAKRNARGHKTSWTGCKLHIDAADGGIPVSCILTSASRPWFLVQGSTSPVSTAYSPRTASTVSPSYQVVEGACRNIVGTRLKCGGMHWTADGANAIMALRCAILSNRFDDFWQRRATRR